MAKTLSTMPPLGIQAPSFSLYDTQNNLVTLDTFAACRGLLVMFMCNHCPYVKHIAPELAKLTSQWQQQGIGVVGINSNDTEQYPEDNLEHMRQEVQLRGYTFPYVLDTTQEVAKAYDAACTPDFFLYDHARHLVYRGQFDASRPGNTVAVTGEHLTAAVEALLYNKAPLTEQIPSLGCNIKWRAL